MLKAVQSDHVFLTDGNQYFNRPGPRLAESLEIVAETLHPDKFLFGQMSLTVAAIFAGAGGTPAVTGEAK